MAAGSTDIRESRISSLLPSPVGHVTRHSIRHRFSIRNNTLEIVGASCYSGSRPDEHVRLRYHPECRRVRHRVGHSPGAGYAWGKYKERRKFGRRLEEYDFYPYTVNRDNFPEFSLNNFRLGMHYFLRNNDPPPRASLSSSANRTTSGPSSSRRSKGLRAPVRQVRRQKDRRRHERIPGELRPHRAPDRQIIPQYRHRNPAPRFVEPVALARRAREQRHRPEPARRRDQSADRSEKALPRERGQAQLRAQHWRPEVQVHQYPDRAEGIRRRRRHLHQRRCAARRPGIPL